MLFPGLIKEDALREQAQPYLDPGEEIQQVFAGNVPGLVVTHQRTFAVTPRRILVLDKKGVVAELPRSTHFIPPGGLQGLLNFTDKFTYGEKVVFPWQFFDAILATEGRAGEPHRLWARAPAKAAIRHQKAEQRRRNRAA